MQMKRYLLCLLLVMFVSTAVIFSCYLVVSWRPGALFCACSGQPLEAEHYRQESPAPTGLNGTQITPVKTYKYILQWNSYYGDYNLGRHFVKQRCPHTDCVFTDNRSLLAVEDFDAVIIHMFRFKLDARPALNEGKLPPRRSPHQRYILLAMEAPMHTGGSSFELMEGIFNWTMTYRLDSDFVRPYGRFFPVKGTPAPALGWLQAPAAPIAPSAAALYAHNYTDAPGKGKKALVAWLVSHCRTPSRREDYAHELSKHIRVDVYGECGTVSWPKNDTNGFYRMLSAKYMFYLSFENALCRDYVTEKFFYVLPLNVVPVVYGGASYSALAPPHSYIDTRDFATPRDLARYLQYLARHPQELAKFWWWKRHYRVQALPWTALCELCVRLHEPALPATRRDVARWYKGPGTCQEPHLV